MSSLFNHIIEVIVDGRFRMDHLGFIFISLVYIQTAWMHRRIDMLHLNCLVVFNLFKLCDRTFLLYFIDQGNLIYFLVDLYLNFY